MATGAPTSSSSRRARPCEPWCGHTRCPDRAETRPVPQIDCATFAQKSLTTWGFKRGNSRAWPGIVTLSGRAAERVAFAAESSGRAAAIALEKPAQPLLAAHVTQWHDLVFDLSSLCLQSPTFLRLYRRTHSQATGAVSLVDNAPGTPHIKDTSAARRS